MASPKGIMGLAFDIIGLLVSVLITCPPIRRVWRLKQMADIDQARRCQWWLLALLFHSITTIMITAKEFIAMLKDRNQLESIDMEYLHLASLIKLLGASFILIVSIILLSRLVSRYPITQDVLIIRLIIGYICTGYLSILLTDFICFEITLPLELILIPITICTHALRFTTQGPLVQFEMLSFILSLIGVIPGALCLIPLGDETFLEHMLKHLAFKIATLFAAVSRTLDAIAVSCHATREAANYFRSRLQECF